MKTSLRLALASASLLARRQQHMNATASTEVRFAPRGEGDEAGLVALQNDDYWFFLGIRRRDGSDRIELRRRAGKTETIVASAPLPTRRQDPVQLRITARGGEYDFAYALGPGAWTELRRGEDGTILSTATAGGFVGAVFGLYASSGTKK